MRERHRFAVLLVLLAALLSVSPAGAAGEKTSVTVYSAGQALVTEVRSLELPKDGSVPFPGAPRTLDTTSVALRSLDAPDKVAVRSVRLLPSAANPTEVLSGYVGRRVKVVLPDPSDAQARVTREATLLSAGSPSVLDLGDEIYVGPIEAVLLPAGEDKPRAEAALLLDVVNRGAARQNVEIAYLAGGLSWSGDCALTLDAEGTVGDISCWATLTNRTGRAFHDASLRLVAGDVNRVAPPPNAPARSYKAEPEIMVFDEGGMGGAPVQRVGEYHAFMVPYPATLIDGQTTRLSLFMADGVRVERELVTGGHALHETGSEPDRMNVGNFLILINEKENGLGSPLPASLVRVYREAPDGGRILEGEASMDNLAVGERERLRLGNAFDVTAQRTMRSYERIAKNRVRVKWDVELRNAGEKTRTVLLDETFRGDWKILSASMKYAKVSANTARWEIEVPAGGEPVVLRYAAEASW